MQTTLDFLKEQVRQSKALVADAIEHGDRKGKWFAEGKLEMARAVLRHHISGGYVA